MPKQISRNISVLIKGEARGSIDHEWDSKVRKFCSQALDGRYPVQRGAGIDVTPDDFARLFAPNGLIDSFVNTTLRPFVDTSSNPWKLRPQELGGVSLSADTLTQLQRAARIRDTFFSGGNTPTVRFEITPISIDPGVRAVLSIEGQEISFDGSSPRPTVVTWPGPSGIRQSTLAFETKEVAVAQAAVQPAMAEAKPAAPAQPAPPPTPVLTKSGAWSLFRLLDAGHLERIGGPDRWRVSFAAGGHRAVYEIHAGSVINPLSSHDIAEFRCPSSL